MLESLHEFHPSFFEVLCPAELKAVEAYFFCRESTEDGLTVHRQQILKKCGIVNESEVIILANRVLVEVGTLQIRTDP